VQNEKRLAAQIVGGGAQAFAEFVDRYGPRLHRLVCRYAVNEADAEDVTQEIFVELYRSLGTFQGKSTLATWVYRVALNHCLKHRERAAPIAVVYEEAKHQMPDPASGPAECAMQSDLSREIHSALNYLSPLQRDVVILHELHELTYRECAEILQVPVGTVKSRLSHAVQHLKSRLRSYVLMETEEAAS